MTFVKTSCFFSFAKHQLSQHFSVSNYSFGNITFFTCQLADIAITAKCMRYFDIIRCLIRVSNGAVVVCYCRLKRREKHSSL
jgi:hypothetical protein